LAFIYRYFWLFLLIFIPVIPRVKSLTLIDDPAGSAASDTALLLDDLLIFLFVGFVVFKLLVGAAVHGRFRITVSQFGLYLASFILYKIVDFSVLAVFLPWNFIGYNGEGVAVKEGVLVLAKSLAFLGIYGIVYAGLRDRKDISVAVGFFIASVVVVVAAGFIQLFVLGHPVLTSTFRNIHALGIINPGVWGSPDPWFGGSAVGHEHLGAFMIIAQAIIMGLLLCRWPGSSGMRKIVIVLWLSCLVVLVFAASRGAWIGGVVSLAVLTWAALKIGRMQQLINIFIVSISVSFIAIEVGDFDVKKHFDARVKGFSRVLDGEVKDDSALKRMELFQVLWDIYKERPLFGWGAGGAGRIAEGQYIRELVEGGIIGLTWFCALIAISTGVTLRLMKQFPDSLSRGLGVGFIAALAGICGQALFTELFILTKVGTPIWCMAAIVHRAYSLGLQDGVSQTATGEVAS